MALFEPATCPFCSLHCDDLRLDMKPGHVVACTPVCGRAAAGYEKKPGGLRPLTALGKSLDRLSALRTAAAWLDNACQPLVVLAGDVDLETARASIRLARSRSAILTLDDRNAASSLSLAMKSAGLLSGTLGELRARAGQLVLLGGLDLEQDQPRFWSFLTADQKASAIHIDAPDPLDTIRHLRLTLRPKSQASRETLTRAAQKINAAPSGAVLIGEAWLQSGTPLLTELLLWLADLNADACWYGFPVIPESNRFGLAETLLTETGYPGNVRYLHGRAQYAPLELQVETLVRGGLVDAVILVGSWPGPEASWLAGLAQAKSIQVSPEPPEGRRDLWFPSARAGVDAAGGMLRLDGVPVRLQPVLASQRPLAAELLAGLGEGADI
jgi:formylmethanofuran dehydrogenase subunit B